MSMTPGGIPVTESGPEALDDVTVTDVFFLGGEKPEEEQRSEMDMVAEKTRATILQQAPGYIRSWEKCGLVSKGTSSRFRRQAAVLQKSVTQDSPAGQTYPTWTAPLFTDEPMSHQINIEDFYTTLDFVPIPRNVRLELYEQNLFEENHITGTAVDLLANAITRRGWEYAQFNNEGGHPIGGDEDNSDEEDDSAELEALEDWVDGLNTIIDFRQIIEHTGATFKVCGNAYLEVIREELGDPESPPAGIDTFISSTMRVVRGHRGFVQWLAGQFRWFNNYFPNEEDRVEGAQKWAEYWASRGVDVNDEEFLASPWSRTINSSMPAGVWNPHLTDVIHFKELSLTSKYYGFPRDYRLGKLNALLQWSIDFNVSFQKNSRIPAGLILYHGRLSPDVRTDIQQYFESYKGATNYGKIPVLEAPPSAGGAGSGGGASGGAQRAGIEFVTLNGQEKDGMFLQLWERVIKDIAMHYGIPLDLLTTENSNRATVIEANESFNDRVVGRFHQVLESKLKQITRYDLGFESRYIRFIDIDSDDMLAKAQEAQIWHNIGVLNANEIRATMLGLPSRPGGDIYWEAGGPAIEDEASEEDSSAQAKDEQGKSAAEKTSAAESAAAQQTQPAPVAQADFWSYLVEKYG